eukprot:TRINITY_DN16312_c0_g1_i1.p1 TRINITY_DN16312_c0_g1~~TRINITY_DN16312_c0_g1_i1.p1  ORF type:complete len:403 (+),score=118.69 TRINITY_DN16312_c0_g1_i1:131-1339(+)
MSDTKSSTSSSSSGGDLHDVTRVLMGAPPASPLAVYRLLSKNGPLRVSPLALGTMNFGTAMPEHLGSVGGKDDVYGILDHYFKQGGNFIDTASNYHHGQSEEWVGDWMADRGVRDQIILATKFSGGSVPASKEGPRINYTGNTRKTLHLSVETSLKRLKTDYIDLLYVHFWDYTTPVEDVMRALDDLVRSGKVLYLGISDTPAWIVSKANMYARVHGLSPFVVYQGEWSVSRRDMERDILPMCKEEGMGLCIWGGMGGGRYKTEDRIKEQKEAGDKGRTLLPLPGWNMSDADKAAVSVLSRVSQETGFPLTSVAMAWLQQKAPYVFPILGARKVEYLKDSIEALKLELSPAHMQSLDSACPPHLGFPFQQFGVSPGTGFLAMAGRHQWLEEQKPLPPTGKGL